MKDHLTLVGAPASQPLARKKVKLLDEREKIFNVLQKEHQSNKNKQHELAAAKKANRLSDLLDRCKSWGGPVTSTEELDKLMDEDWPDKRQKLRAEICLRKLMDPIDAMNHSQNYKVNKMTEGQLSQNLKKILDGESNDGPPLIWLEEEIISILFDD